MADRLHDFARAFHETAKSITCQRHIRLNAENVAWLRTSCNGKGIGATNDSFRSSMFNNPLECKLLAIFDGKEFISEASIGQTVGFIFDKSNFISSSDKDEDLPDNGVIKFDDKKIIVEDVQKFSGFVLHIGRTEGAGPVAVGTTGTAIIDFQRRIETHGTLKKEVSASILRMPR